MQHDRDKLSENIRRLLPFPYSYESRRRKFEYTEETFLGVYSTCEAKPNEPLSVRHFPKINLLLLLMACKDLGEIEVPETHPCLY